MTCLRHRRRACAWKDLANRLAPQPLLLYKLRVRRNLVDLSTGSGIGAILLWSATFAFARSLSEQVGPLTAGAAAYLIGGCVCLLRLACSSPPSTWLQQIPRKYLFGCGSVFVFYTAAIYAAVGLASNREQLLEVALVNYLWPTLTILFSLILLKPQARLWLVPGTALALTGIFLVMTQGANVSWRSFAEHVQANPLAYALALAAALSWALYSNLSRRWSGSGARGAVDLFIPATGFVLLSLRCFTTEPTHWSVRAIGEATGLAAVTTLAYVLWDISMRKGNLLLVVVCSYFTPLLSTGVSCIYLRVSPSPRLWLGCLLLISGSLMTWVSVSGQRNRGPAPNITAEMNGGPKRRFP
jgi:drug/metabolite transporter (DMT)-like permease